MASHSGFRVQLLDHYRTRQHHGHRPPTPSDRYKTVVRSTRALSLRVGRRARSSGRSHGAHCPTARHGTLGRTIRSRPPCRRVHAPGVPGQVQAFVGSVVQGHSPERCREAGRLVCRCPGATAHNGASAHRQLARRSASVLMRSSDPRTVASHLVATWSAHQRPSPQKSAPSSPVYSSRVAPWSGWSVNRSTT